MIEYQAYLDKEKTLKEISTHLRIEDLKKATNEMIDKQLGMIKDCSDADVVFTPVDPEAHDPYAENVEDEEIAWNLGHLIVHVTASSEESAFMAAELARGVDHHGRSRYETPWEEVTTMQQCIQRLEESRRMRLASLDIWPDEPHFGNTYQTREDRPKINCQMRFVYGLLHDYDHLEQIAEVIRQAKASR